MKKVALAFALLAAVAAARQDPPRQDPPRQEQPTPTFRSAVDLVPVDVSIIDRDGRPVDGLKAEDFTLTVDGKPRRIASAEFIKVTREAEPPPRPAHYSTNAHATGGRLVMIVIDQGNIGAGRGRAASDAAGRFVSRLNPSDRVGLFAIPGAGLQLDFTANHALVKTMLQKIVGQVPSTVSRRVGASEAARIDRGDELAMRSLMDRECPNMLDPGELALCRAQVVAEAREVFADVRDRTKNSVLSLRYLLERLAETSTPKTVIFISEGLIIDRDYGEVSWMGPLAAKGQIAFYVLQLDTPQFDASSSRISPSRTEDIHLAEEGLGMMAGLARGTVFRIVANADYAFNRLALELSGYYLLGFEPEPGDRDGKPHKINVQVPGRRGIEVRARREFNVEPVRTKTDEQLVVETLRAPLLASDVPLNLSAYTFWDTESDRLRIMVAADIDRSMNPTGKLAVGYLITDARGRAVASQFEPDLKAQVDPVTRTQHFVGSTPAGGPGVYRIKLAVVDEKGRRGSVEHAFRAQLTQAGQLRATDLLIVENAGSRSGIAPAVDGEFTTDTLHGYIELYSDSESQLNDATVTLEIADGDNGRTLEGGALHLQDVEAGGKRVAEGSVPIALLPPGQYVARAVINVGGRKAGQVTRPFAISRAAPNVTAPGAGMPGVRPSRAPIPFASRIDAFDRKAVLAPAVVGFFLDRMNVANRAPAPAEAAAHAKEGRFDEAMKAASATDSSPLAAAFLGGLALYAKGDLEAAAVKFRETLRLDSEFFPAAFYLGSCYAAGGRDRDAAAAWQTSLVTESDAPFIYTLLGDALLRMREVEQAVDILKEAATLWPANDEVRLRHGTALAMAGQPAESLKVLEPYLAAHPEDHERHFLALRAIYEAHAAGRTIGTAEEDRARFDRYAAVYASAGGPQQALVDQWKKYLEKK